jgi:chromosomal replication initiator protein
MDVLGRTPARQGGATGGSFKHVTQTLDVGSRLRLERSVTMRKLDPALWRDMMAYLRQRHAPICRQWFEELEPLALDAGLLQVRTATAVQQNYLQRKCVEQFTEAAQATTGALIAVRFINTDNQAVGPADAAPSSTPSAAASTSASASTSAAASSTASASAAGGDARSPHHDQDPRGGAKARPAAAPFLGIPAPRPIPVSAQQHERFADQIVISPDHSFDNFVTGPNNRLAYAAAVAVADQPGTAYNPLFIHGGVGLGKTHLLQAICQQIMTARPGAVICYLSCDAFMNHFIEAVQQGNMTEFRHYFRQVDVLVIDDIHFLAKGDRSQEEFFHTFNELYQSQRQIVLSSDSPPSEIPQLEERLVSRFQWGLVANVTRPSYETRVAIIRAKSKLRGLELPDDVIDYIATRVDSNARELEGALTTIQGYAALQGLQITIDLARQAQGDPAAESRTSQVTLQNIIDAVTEFYNIKLSDLQSRRRHKSVTEPRQVCMWLARKRTRFSLEEIGAYFGGRDHTTVMHSIRTVDDRKSTEPAFAEQVTLLDQRISKTE